MRDCTRRRGVDFIHCPVQHSTLVVDELLVVSCADSPVVHSAVAIFRTEIGTSPTLLVRCKMFSNLYMLRPAPKLTSKMPNHPHLRKRCVELATGKFFNEGNRVNPAAPTHRKKIKAAPLNVKAVGSAEQLFAIVSFVSCYACVTLLDTGGAAPTLPPRGVVAPSRLVSVS